MQFKWLRWLRSWKVSIGLSVVILIGFEIIDKSIAQLQPSGMHYADFMVTAKWLLVAGFALNGIISWWLERHHAE